MKVFSLFLLLVSFNSEASNQLAGKKFLFKYEEDQHYLVTFTETTVTWLAVKGDETGRNETDNYQAALIAPNVYFIQWSELDGTFVVLTINVDTKKIISTGVFRTYKWFRNGTFLQK